MHNNIMAAGSKDRPPMLGPGRYSQWRSRFLRYIDTKGNGEYLRKCIFEGPYKLTSVVIEVVAATVNSLNTSSTDSQMHNNIMAAGSKDRPPMLGPGRYSQWRSRFLRYIDTKGNGEYLRKCIFEGPYKLTSVVIEAVAATVNSPEVPQHDEAETVHNMSAENKLYFQAEKEAIFLLLTGVGDEIYSTVDACNTSNEMWIAIERLQQGESLNVQDVKTNLFWEFGKFTSRDGESMESYYSRFYKLMNELTRNNLQVTTMQQYQNEVNDIRAERIAKSANPLELLAAAQPYSCNYYQAPKPQRSNATSSSTRPSASTRHKGKEIAKPVTPQSESVSKRRRENKLRRIRKCRKIWLLLQSTSRNSTNLPTTTSELPQTPETKMWILLQSGQVVQQSGIQCFNCKEFGHFSKECRKPKRVKDSTYHKEKMLLCKQAEKGVQIQAEQSDWLADTDEEIDEQELEAHYSYMAKIQEVPNADSGTDSEPLEQVQYDTGYNVFANEIQHSKQSESISNTCVVETGDSNVIPDSPDMCDNDIQTDHNVVECDDERVALANLIANLKLDIDENKTIQKQLKKANASLTQELKECKSTLAETSRTLGESNIIQEKHDELVKQSLLTKSHYEGLVKEKTKVITDLKLKEEEDIDKMISMENQLKFLNEIVYKRSKSIQTIHMLAHKCPTFNVRPTFANLMYLKKAQYEKPCLYEIPHDQSDPANRLVPDREEILTLKDES
ncbi:retrovirus-related pol polyprotein from transposon TNT 1-94 [Tanacetum coccineum]